MTRAVANLFAPVLLAAVAASSARAECPRSYEFVLIADDTGELALSDAEFGGQPTLPALDADGNVAFTAWLDAGGRAIFHGDEHELRERLRDRDADPESGFSLLSDPLPGIEGKVVFGGQLELGPGQASAPAIAEITAPGRVDTLAVGDAGREGSTSAFRSLDPSAFDVASNGEVVFSARLRDHLSVIAKGRGGATETVVTADPGVALGNPAAGGPGEFCYFEYAGAGPVLRAASGLVIAETDAATGLGPLPPVAMGEGGAVAYTFTYADPDRPGYAARQIRRYSPVTQTSRVLTDSADGDFDVAGEQPHVSIIAGEIDVAGQSPGIAGCVVFDAQGEEGRDTLFIVDEDGIAPVLAEGDELLGAPVASVQSGSHAVNGRGQIAFWAQTTDRRRMIVRADPAPGADGPADTGAGMDPPDDPRDPSGGEDDNALEAGAGAPSRDAGAVRGAGRDEAAADSRADEDDDGGGCAVRTGRRARSSTWLPALLALLAVRRRPSRGAAPPASVIRRRLPSGGAPRHHGVNVRRPRSRSTSPAFDVSAVQAERSSIICKLASTIVSTGCDSAMIARISRKYARCRSRSRARSARDTPNRL